MELLSYKEMEFCNLIRERRSSRHFSEEYLEKEVIEQLIEEASFSPSAGNQQPWRVVAVSPLNTSRIVEKYEATCWETIYPVLCNIIEKDPRFIGREVRGEELVRETVQFVKKELFIQGSPWLLIVYQVKPTLRKTVRRILSAVKMTIHRLQTLSNNIERFRLLSYIVRNSIDTLRKDRKTNESSLSNFLYSLHLAAATRGLASCIQFSWTMVEKQLGILLGMEKRASILGALVVGYPKEQNEKQFQRRIKERRKVPVIWY